MSTLTQIEPSALNLHCPPWCGSDHLGSGRLVDLDHCSATEVVSDENGRLVGDVFVMQRGELSDDLTVVYSDVRIGAEIANCGELTAEHARALAALLLAAAERLERGGSL